MIDERSEEAAGHREQHLGARFGVLKANRAFTRVWIGEAVADVGSQITTIAMPLLVLAITRSPADAGFVGVARWVATAAAVIPAGVLADRLSRRGLMLACAAVRAAAVGSVPLAFVLGRPVLAQLIVVALIDASLSSVSYVAERSLLPEVVPPSQLSEALTVNEARSAGAVLAGPPIGGALFGLARFAPFVADLLLSIAAFVSLFTLRLAPRPRRRVRSARVVAEIREGFAWLMAKPLLRAGALLYAAENVTVLAVQLLGLLILRRHGASSAGIGFAYTLVGAGGVLSAVLANPLRRRLSVRLGILIEPWTYALLLPLLLVVHSILAVGVTIGAMTLPMTLSTSIIVGRRLTETPEHLRGRVQASGAFVAVSLTWLGPLAVGLLVQYAGVSAAVLALTGWSLATAVLASATKGFRIPSPALGPAPTG